MQSLSSLLLDLVTKSERLCSDFHLGHYYFQYEKVFILGGKKKQMYMYLVRVIITYMYVNAAPAYSVPVQYLPKSQ